MSFNIDSFNKKNGISVSFNKIKNSEFNNIDAYSDDFSDCFFNNTDIEIESVDLSCSDTFNFPLSVDQVFECYEDGVYEYAQGRDIFKVLVRDGDISVIIDDVKYNYLFNNGISDSNEWKTLVDKYNGNGDFCYIATDYETKTPVLRRLIVRDGVAYILDKDKNGNDFSVLIANKTYILPQDYGVSGDYSDYGVTSDGILSLKQMKQYMINDPNFDESWDLYSATTICSGYRSFNVQKDLYRGYGKSADLYSARAGSSEHQTHLAFDVFNAKSSQKDKFYNESEYLKNNCYKCGLILRYPYPKYEDGNDIVINSDYSNADVAVNPYTGYVGEYWHFRYVGEELAEKLYNNGDWISIEEYYGLTSKYGD